MVRTQIQLTEKQAKALKELAASRHVSVAELIRQSIDSTLSSSTENSRKEQWRRALAAAEESRSRSDNTDVSINHDRYLAEAYDS